jgi:hypothetical protein
MAGDFRLRRRAPTAKGTKRSALEIVDPSLGEREVLLEFLREAHAKGWTQTKDLHLRPTRDVDEHQIVKLTVGVDVAGARLVELLKPGEQTLTAVKYDNGELKVTTSATSEALVAAVADPAPVSERPTRPEPEPKPKPDKAVSVKRPTPCCPNCQPGSVERASQVLVDFLSPKQHEQWAAHRYIDVIGHLSGHRYRLAHRHSELAHQWGKICADFTDGAILHFHDWSVPPEEEVLAAKLCIEHCEPWLRNEATCFLRAGFTDVFPNPFGDITDGIADAALTRQVGAFFLGMVGRTGTQVI